MSLKFNLEGLKLEFIHFAVLRSYGGGTGSFPLLPRCHKTAAKLPLRYIKLVRSLQCPSAGENITK